VVLGAVGRNFAAGMSGGIAYVLDADGTFARHCNPGMVALDEPSEADLTVVRGLIQRHYNLTESRLAWRVLSGWKTMRGKLVKVMPTDYRKVLAAQHLDTEAAKLASI